MEGYIHIQNASEEFFGHAGGKLVTFDFTEEKKGETTRTGKILVQVGEVTPIGGRRGCWGFDGQVLSEESSLKKGTRIRGFYRKEKGGWIHREI